MDNLTAQIQHYNRLSSKRIGVGGLIFDQAGKLLILKPGYAKDWTIPGGSVENVESPLTAMIRETREEISLDLKPVRIVCLDYIHAEIRRQHFESVQIIFEIGQITSEQINNIKIDHQEIIDYQFLSPTNAYRLLDKRLSSRVKGAMTRFTDFKYLENGRIVI